MTMERREKIKWNGVEYYRLEERELIAEFDLWGYMPGQERLCTWPRHSTQSWIVGTERMYYREIKVAHCEVSLLIPRGLGERILRSMSKGHQSDDVREFLNILEGAL